MKILLITDEIWNDLVFGNNVLANWFNDMPNVELAQIGCLPVKPFNRMCTRYFQLTDSSMAKSIFGPPAGHSFNISLKEMRQNPQTKNYIASSSFYTFMKKISGTPIKLLREFIWTTGHYNKTALQKFIDDFNPDIVFCPRLTTWKLMRLEKAVAKMTNAPFVGFTADDEASFRQYNWSLLYWINRYFFHHSFSKHIHLFKHYFTFSQDQCDEYIKEYGIPATTLYKCGEFAPKFTQKQERNPIRLVYAGRLYCNRWKSLAEIGKALKIINSNGIKMVLDIYSQEQLTDKQRKALTEENFIYFKGSVSPKELTEIYRKADIALHVESFNRTSRLSTRVSFSTKIIDLMASSCAILAVCWEEHAGFKYLKENDAAFCIDSYEKILPNLQRIVDNPELISEYAEKAYRCGVKNHNKQKIQNQIISKFKEVIAKS